MTKYDVSILMPAIRTHLWENMYNTILESCTKYSFELVLISPFELPKELTKYSNIKLIKDLGCPTRCAQLGIEHCEGELLYHCVDDAKFRKNAIDLAIDFYKSNCARKDVVNMRYTEGQNFAGQELDLNYWTAWSDPGMRLIGIPEDTMTSLHHLISLEYFKEIGGWDCQFEYLNHSLHDFMLRVQADGGKVFQSPETVTNCDHYPGRTVDHAPIHDAQTLSDAPKFNEIYSKKSNAAKDRIKIELDNWKQQPAYWERRFKGAIPSAYYELLILNR